MVAEGVLYRISQADARQAAAFLAMWKVLRTFDQLADRWADPAPSTSRSELEVWADEALRRALRESGGPPGRRSLSDDASRYRATLARLATGEAFSAEDRRFCEEIAAEGSRLADASVERTSTAESGLR